MRKAEVYLFDRLAGYIEERDPRGFRFWYDKTYLSDSQAIPLSPLMPLSRDVVETETLPAFFDGLIPEGWLLNIAERTWKLNPRDRFGCLLACCRDCIGAASIREATDE